MTQKLSSIILLFLIQNIFCQVQYPKLIDEKNSPNNFDNYKDEYFQEFLIYKTTVTKDSTSLKTEKRDKIFPWEIIKNDNPQTFFNEIIKSIKIENLENETKFALSASYNLSSEKNKEYKATGKIINKNDLNDLLEVKIISSNLIDRKTNKKLDLKNDLTRFCCNLITNTNPIQEKMFFYDYLGKSDLKDTKGTLNIQVSIPTEYSVVKITKNDIGKTIDIGENQKIKLIEFAENKVHFEIIGNEKLKTEIAFTNVSGNIKNNNMPKFLYQFFRLNPEMKYKEFEKN